MSPGHQKTIGIFAYLERGVSSWDPDSKGLTGSEEAIVYFSKELAKKGHRVFVFGTAPSFSSHARTNPCFVRDLNAFFIPIDVGIVWRMAYLGP